MTSELCRFVGKDVEVELIRRVNEFPESETGTLVVVGEHFLVLRSYDDERCVDVELAVALGEISTVCELPPSDDETLSHDGDDDGDNDTEEAS